MAEIDVATTRRGPGPAVETPAAREVELGGAVRTGVLGALAAIFVSAIGMAQSFQARRIVEGITLGYVLLAAIAAIAGYLAARPPAQLEGFAAPRRGPRNALAGLVAGGVTGAGLAIFVLFVGTVDIRERSSSTSPRGSSRRSRSAGASGPARRSWCWRAWSSARSEAPCTCSTSGGGGRSSAPPHGS
jgi:hypothetical protein